MANPLWVQDRDCWTVEEVYDRLERPVIPVVVAMQENGIRLDAERLSVLNEKITVRLEELRVGVLANINPNSNKQVAGYLYDYRGLKPQGRSKKTGQASVDEKSLTKLLTKVEEDDRLFIQAELEWRELHKLRSTYVLPLPLAIGGDGRLHGEFLQWGTDTGRFASRNPNLQNLPTHTSLGLEVLEAFVPDEGNVFVKVDYSQIELRVIAMMSREVEMVEAFRSGKDIHQALLDTLGWPKEWRVRAKTINFGIPYGMEAATLGYRLGVSRKESQEYLDSYWATHPSVKRMFDIFRAQAEYRGCMETLWGRRFYTDIPKGRGGVREAALREACNMPIQGGAADVMKLYMPQAHSIGLRRGARVLMQEHDALVFEVEEDRSQELLGELIGEAEEEIEALVPIVLDGKVGRSLREVKED